MARIALKQVIGGQPAARALVDVVAGALGVPVSIEDLEGKLLQGATGLAGATRFPVQHDDQPLGWVSGPASAQALASLLDHLVAREVERKALGSEVLHLYREINLIYSFSEKLAALLDVKRVAALTLQEARHLIAATDGAILLLDESSDGLTSVASFGEEMTRVSQFRRGTGIIGAVADAGVAEIVNDLEDDARRAVRDTTLRALIAAPLKVGERVIGVVALGSTLPMSYTAAELKLLTTLALQAATAIENARLFERTIEAALERERLQALHREAELARARLESELTLAARIQSDLFPASLPAVPGYELAARNRPARQCGGDYYDALPVPASDGRVLLCVADVAGKGLPAALVMSNMQATLRALLGRIGSMPDLAWQASDLLYASTSPEKYVTAALVDLHPPTGAIRWVGAGHLDNIIVRASGDAVSLVSTGTPLGLLPAMLPYGEVAHDLAPGDTLVLFSDGVTEAQGSDGEEFGEARLLDVLRQVADTPVAAVIDRIFHEIDVFAGQAPQFDDITMLVVRRLADPAVSGPVRESARRES
jgi:serine phosphatase RsbU (regulator of sigma subunit)